MPRCSAAGLDFRIIPAGFNPLRQRLRGECPAGISNGVYCLFVGYKIGIRQMNEIFGVNEGGRVHDIGVPVLLTGGTANT